MARQEFYGRWEDKGIVFEMFRRWGDGIKDHLEMECYPTGKESEKKVFARTTRYRPYGLLIILPI